MTAEMCGISNVSTGKVCGRTAEYEVTIRCSGCPVSKRTGTVYTCNYHLSRQTQGLIVCNRCRTVNMVIDWKKLPDVGKITPVNGSEQPISPRIGDARRNEVIDTLSEAFATGVLKRDEFDDRMEKAGSAVTESDLTVLTADLPRSSDVEPHSPVRLLAALYWLAIFLLGMIVGIVIIALAMAG
jgi:hypothetical protein